MYSINHFQVKVSYAKISSPKLLQHIIDILARCLPNNEQITIPGECHDLGRMEKPEVFNTSVLEFLFKYR
jgi:hypothetical protein